MKRTRRTLPGTLAPGDAYAPSLFDDTAPALGAPPAPLALFSTDVGAGALPPLAAPPAPCAVCGDREHLTAACPKGAPVALFGPSVDRPAPDRMSSADLADERTACLAAIETTRPDLAGLAGLALDRIEANAPEAAVAEVVAAITEPEPNTRYAAGKGATLVSWPADQPGPFDPPTYPHEHPNGARRPGDLYACPHCGRADELHSYAGRDYCPSNEVHPYHCRCGWCTYGVTFEAAPDGRGRPLERHQDPAR